MVMNLISNLQDRRLNHQGSPMLTKLKFKLLNMFREFLVYHSSSLEFRAELILLMVMSDNKIIACEEKVIEKIASDIYRDDADRSRLLLETIHEFHDKVVVRNGLEYTDLITKITNDIKRNPRFVDKINIEHLEQFKACIVDEEERIFHDRLIEFLRSIKDEYGKL